MTYAEQEDGTPPFDWTAALSVLGPALSAAEVGIWRIDMLTGLGTWDAVTSVILGRDPDPQSFPVPLPVHPDDMPKVARRLELNLRGEGERDVEVRIVRPNGEIRWVRSTARPPAEKDGPKRWLIGILKDITEEKLAQHSLSESQRQLATLVDNLPGIAYRCALEAPWQFDFVSEGVFALTGISSDEFVSGGLGWASLVHPDDQIELEAQVEAACATGIPFEVTYRIKKRDGETRWVNERGRAVHDAAGNPIALEGFIGDITERKLLEESAVAILDHVPQITWVADAEGRCSYLSSQWYAFTGRDTAGPVQEEWAAAVHPDDAEKIVEIWDRSVTSGSPFIAEFRLRHQSGDYRWVLARAVLRRAEIGMEAWYGSCTDIHDRVSATNALNASEALNKGILESSPDCIKLLEADGTILYVNPLGPAALEIEDPAGLIGACWFDLLSPASAQRAREAVSKALRRGKLERFTIRQPTAKGSMRIFDIIVSPLRSGSKRSSQTVVIARDISERTAAEDALRASELLHRSILEASSDCIKILDRDGIVEMMNTPGMCAMEIDDFGAIQGRDWAQLWPEDSRELVASAVADARRGKAARFSEFCPTAKGTPKWWDVAVTPIIDGNGTIARILAISRDISTTRKKSEQLRWASEHDALTSLPNRRAFQKSLEAATIRAMNSGGTLGLLLLDLDHFKHINDTLGHQAGDHLLKTFSRRLKGSVRQHDVVARLGGDEFAVILENIKGQDDLLSAGESILRRLNDPIKFDERVLSAGASIGGAMFPADASTANDLFKNADMALYALKASGRGGTRMFHNYMREHTQKISSQLSLARVAISERSIIPHYQPKVDLETGRICGFEALLRWRHPAAGIQYPDTVAEAFKDYELASKIGQLMQSKIFSQMKSWRQQGLETGRISLNAAPAEFLRDDYAERLLAHLSAFDVAPDWVEVEVTEHVFIDRGAEFVSRALSMLSVAGVLISLDDFGTGYSSLSHLRDFPVDVVKIDRSFVSRMLDEPEIGAIVSGVIDLTKSLSLDVVAEGVETEGQAEFLRRKGCRLVQGYFFGRAVDSKAVAVLLKQQYGAVSAAA